MVLSVVIVLSWVSALGNAWAQTPGATFESVIEYSDATVEIRQPRLNNLRINNGSDKNGVCKMLGYPAALGADLESNTGRDNCDRPSVRIDLYGRDAGRNACDMFNSNATIAGIRCHPKNYQYIVPTTYLERVENTDGTVSILSPWFSRLDQLGDVRGRRYIHEGSDMTGVCRHFGLGAYVDGSLVAEDRCEMRTQAGDRTVRLDQYGRFAKEDDCDSDMILFISCRRR